MKKILSAVLVLFVFISMAGLSRAQSNLTVLTGGASNVTQNSAVLNGSYAINVGGSRDDRPQTFFQYGVSTSFGQSTPARSHSRLFDSISVEVEGLLPATTYYVRAVAQNRGGTVYGPTASFVTLSPPTPTTPANTGTTVTVIQQPGGTAPAGQTGGNTGTTGTTTGGTVTTGGNNTNTPVPAHVALDITDDRETFTVGDILTYLVAYENVSNTEIDDVFIKVELPENTEFLSAGEGVYLRKEHAAVFDIGTLEEDEDGDIKVNVRAVTALREGTRVAAAAVLFYTNPTTDSQASAVHYDINEYDSDGRPAGATTKGGFLPRTFLGWLIIIVILLAIFLIGRKIYLRYKEQKEQEQAERELEEVIKRDMDRDDLYDTRETLEDAPRSIDDVEPQFMQDDASDVPEGENSDPWSYDEDEEGDSKSDKDLDSKKKDFLDNLPS